MFGIQDYHKATWGQNFVASVAGAVASITVAAPLDTVKTRIQNANFENKVSGMTVVKDLVKNEGPGALFKGLTPKVRHPPPIVSCRARQAASHYAAAADTGTLRVRLGTDMLACSADPRRGPEACLQLHARAVPHPLVLEIRLRRLSYDPH